MATTTTTPPTTPSLGTVWTAERAVEAWCQGELKSLDNDEDDDDDGDDTSQRLRLILCNNSNDEEDLVYSWITPQGKLSGFRKILAKKSTNQKNLVQDDDDDDDDDEENERGGQRRAHVERTFFGHLFVFGRLADPTISLSKIKNLQDIIVLGAYRSVLDQQDKEQDFPCHVLTLEPTSNQGLLPFSDCTKVVGCQPAKNKRLRGKKKQQQQEDISYTIDPSWTIRVELAPPGKELIDTTQTMKYIETTLCDWPVCLQEGCFENKKNHKKKKKKNKTPTPAVDPAERMRQLFCNDLQAALDCLPEHARNRLKAAPCKIWINQSGLTYGPTEAPETLRDMCFHPESDWLRDHKMHVDKARCIEIYDLDEFCRDRHYWGLGGQLLHELSHAYHCLCLPDGYDNAQILDCFEKAMKRRLYHYVPVHGPQGPFAKAYACENAMEYFAELSAAFLGGHEQHDDDPRHRDEEYNKWYPFNRSQIQQHDPLAYEMLCQLWKINSHPEKEEDEENHKTTKKDDDDDDDDKKQKSTKTMKKIKRVHPKMPTTNNEDEE